MFQSLPDLAPNYVDVMIIIWKMLADVRVLIQVIMLADCM